jgi:hypothetical protein
MKRYLVSLDCDDVFGAMKLLETAKLGGGLGPVKASSAGGDPIKLSALSWQLDADSEQEAEEKLGRILGKSARVESIDPHTPA